MDGKLAPGLSRKLKKVLECRTDSPDVLSSLNTLSSFYAENTPQSRRNLRSSIEKRGISINVDFLEASRAAQQALDRVEDEVNALANCCDKIAKALNSCSATTGDIITTTERLKQELNVTTQRQQIVSCFLRDYQLSNQEVTEYLYSLIRRNGIYSGDEKSEIGLVCLWFWLDQCFEGGGTERELLQGALSRSGDSC